MNLFETLDNYKTTPDKELHKINDLLNRRRKVPFDREYCFFEVLDYSFRTSFFSSYDLDVNSFIKNIVYKDYNRDDEKTKIITYRRMCEFLYNLIKNGLKSKFVETFYSDNEQLKNLILGGLRSCGYEMIDYGKQKVTKKIDELAESIASVNEEYNKNILDYLLAKSVDEKEKVLTSFANQLEAIKSNDSYLKKTREYIQLMRHKDEYINETKYAWFYNEKTYEDNLDKLFKIFLSIVSYNNCQEYLEEFKKNKGD